MNDFAVAANYLFHKKLASKILIIDLDVHQGNGTAKIFEGEDRVFTLSAHGEHNYPFHKEKSDLDIALPAGIKDEEYLKILAGLLPPLLDKVKPDFVFYLSGVDVLSTDKYGKFDLSMEGCRKRDELVFSLLQSRHLPVAVAMGGGYSPEIRHIVEAHCNTFREGIRIYNF